MFILKYIDDSDNNGFNWQPIVDEQQSPLVLQSLSQARTVARLFIGCHKMHQTRVKIVHPDGGQSYLPETKF